MQLVYVQTHMLKSATSADRFYSLADFFLFFDENIYRGYWLEAPPRGASNKYPQHMVL